MKYLNRRNLITGGAALVVLLVVAAGVFFAKDYFWPAPQEVAVGEPVDVVLDFYEPWLAAAQATTTNPYKEGFAKSPILSKELRKHIQASRGTLGIDLDPVLCQTRIPTQISARLISKIESQAQVLVVSREKKVTEQAIIDLVQLGEGWYIDNITCSPGEFGPEREFSFDMEGFLLKSVAPPLNPQFWHLVFVQNDVPGHVVPLFFSPESTCIAVGGAQTVCDPSTFMEPSKAHVQGEMTETGVKVKRLQLMGS